MSIEGHRRGRGSRRAEDRTECLGSRHADTHSSSASSAAGPIAQVEPGSDRLDFLMVLAGQIVGELHDTAPGNAELSIEMQDRNAGLMLNLLKPIEEEAATLPPRNSRQGLFLLWLALDALAESVEMDLDPDADRERKDRTLRLMRSAFPLVSQGLGFDEAVIGGALYAPKPAAPAL